MLSVTSRLTRNLFSTAVMLALGSAAIPSQATAQGTAAAIPEKVTLNIPAQPLKSALRVFAGATHLQLVYTSDLVAGLGSGGVSGSYAPAAALQQLLAGSGLVSRFTSPGVVTLEKLSADGAKVIGTVEVEGAKTAGANGSTDVTATEGTHSYTTDAMTIGSKTAQSIRETPQSVTVITQQQMQDQNITNLAQALTQAAGIEVTTDTNGNAVYYSRGFQITNFQIDGSPIGANPFTQFVQPGLSANLAEYDHVEVLRGPDGMFAGNGDPGGTVNLTRKKPLDHTQVIFEGAVGSWNNDRAMLDVTGPVPGTNGKVRTRIVVEDQQQDYFYRLANSANKTVYGHVEVDLTPSTLLGFGASYGKQTGIPWTQGLPRAPDGTDLHLPRDTCFCLPWNNTDNTTKEVFASLMQKIGEDWKLKLNMTDKTTTTDDFYGYLSAGSGGIAPGLTKAASISATDVHYPFEQLAADAALSGKFSLLGHEHTVVVGADLSYTDQTGYTAYNIPTLTPLTYLTYAQLVGFDPNAYAKPLVVKSNYYTFGEQQQYGVYSTLKLALLDSLHLSVGARDSAYGYDIQNNLYNSSGSSATGALVAVSKSLYQKSGTLTPYGGLVWDLNKEWSLYGSYTDIFKVQPNIDRTGNLLPPITGSNYEFGTKAELLNNKLKYSLAFYKSERYNVAVLDSSTPVVGLLPSGYVASGKSTSQGIDTELTGEVMPGWQITTSYVYNDNHTDSGGTASNPNGAPILTIFPHHIFKLWSTYQLPGEYNKWTIGGGVNFQSTTYVSGNVCLGTLNPAGLCKDENNNTINKQPFNFTQAPYAVFGARVAYKFDEHWQASLKVDNIFDKVYYSTVGGISNGNWYGAPRNAMLTVRGSW
jgi:outer-membrane receptor for ferric coprogen and ferric-rhodotorulic acid